MDGRNDWWTDKQTNRETLDGSRERDHVPLTRGVASSDWHVMFVESEIRFWNVDFIVWQVVALLDIGVTLSIVGDPYVQLMLILSDICHSVIGLFNGKSIRPSVYRAKCVIQFVHLSLGQYRYKIYSLSICLWDDFSRYVVHVACLFFNNNCVIHLVHLSFLSVIPTYFCPLVCFAGVFCFRITHDKQRPHRSPEQRQGHHNSIIHCMWLSRMVKY